MNENLNFTNGVALRLMLFAACAGLVAIASPALSQTVIAEDANKILVAMTDNLKSLTNLSADYDADHEVIDKTGQKLQYSASGTMALSRGKGLRLTRKGPYADVEVISDGKTISLADLSCPIL